MYYVKLRIVGEDIIIRFAVANCMTINYKR